MKNTTTYTTGAVVGSVLKYYNMKDLAAKIAGSLSDDGHELSLDECKSDGIVYRIKRDCTVKDSDIIKAIAKAIKKMVKESDLIESYISDTYNIEYDSDDIDTDKIESIIDIRRSGRKIYLEIDM